MKFTKLKLAAVLAIVLGTISPTAASNHTEGEAEYLVRSLYVTHAKLLLRYAMPVWSSYQAPDYFSEHVDAQLENMTQQLNFDPLFNADGEVIEDLTIDARRADDPLASQDEFFVSAKFKVSGERVVLVFVVAPDGSADRLQVHDIIGPDWTLTEMIADRQPRVADASAALR